MWGRRLSSTLWLFVLPLLGIVLLPPSAVSTGNDLGYETFGDPDHLAGEIAQYAGLSEEKQVQLVGNVVGHMAAMFRSHPDRVDEWIAPISNKRIEAFAVIALGLAGDPDKAARAAEDRKVDPAIIVSILNYPGGSKFPEPQASWRGASIAGLLARNGTLETAPQTFGWHQDLLWSAAATWRDGMIALRILGRMDEIFKLLNLQPGALPFGAGDTEAAKRWYRDLVKEEGETAAQEHTLAVGYVLAGAWSFGSNIRYPFVAAAYAKYAAEHPASRAVAEVMHRGGRK